MSEIMWRPDEGRAAASAIRRLAASKGFEGIDAVERLYDWSVREPAAFWQTVWEEGDVRAGTPFEAVLTHGERMPGATWFKGARLNYAQNLLRRRDDTPALIFIGENGDRRVVSWADLWREVGRLAAALKADGVGIGDRVAAYLPNIPEAVIGLLATASLGAIWSSASPDFGIDGVLDRFGQIEPKVLITVDGYRYAGKRIDIQDKVSAVVEGLPSLVRCAVIPFLDAHAVALPAALSDARSVLFQKYVAGVSGDGIGGAGAAGDALDFVQLPFDHPLYILYSSGTTGKPKAIVHGAGGTLLQHIKEHRFHGDAKPGDRFFFFTTCGWMMWNWLIGGLACEETLILYDGSPFHPEPTVLWDLAQAEGIHAFGTSAKYIDACKKAGLAPARSHDLDDLRVLFSTGSPLVPESFDYVYEAIKPDMQLASMSGGTDIVSCFVLGNPAGPVHRGEIQMRGLGLAVEVWNDEGMPVRAEKGELVCTRPFPSMPVAFWNDDNGVRYRDSYFTRFEGVWCHGDFAEITASGGMIIHGRSDTVLNPGGVRIGTAEIYRQVEQILDVQEAICVGQDWEGDVRVVLFVRLQDTRVLDEDLEQRIRVRIRQNCTPRHVPAKIVQIADIPRTRSGKISEIAVRDIIHGRKVKNTEALANPEALKLYEGLETLQS